MTPTKKISRKISGSLLLLSAAALLTPSTALYAEEIDLTEISIEELMDVTVISASKKRQKASEVAASAYVISNEDIRRYGYRTLGESLRKISGMYLSSDRNYDYLGVRGFSLPGDYNTKILILIDGHRVNNALYDQAAIEEAFPVDIENIERIEVVKGPGSAMWGSNALFAVINVITHNPNNHDGGRITAEVGSHNRQKGHIEYCTALENGLSVTASISGMATDGENHIYFQERNLPGYQFNNGVASGVDEEESYKGFLSMSYKDLRFLFYTNKRSKDVPTAAWDGAFNDDGMYTTDENTAFELSYNTTLMPEKNGELSLRLYHDSFDYYGEYPWFEFGGWSGTRIDNKDEGYSKQWGTEIRYSMDATDKLAITAGFEYLDVYESHQKNWDAGPAGYEWLYLHTGEKDNTYHSVAWYAQGEYALLDNLTLVAGLRLDDYSTFDEQWSPRAALLYSPFTGTTLKLLYGEAFRAPNNYERFYEDGIWQTGNINLEPEEIETWEFVWEQKIGDHSRLVANLYRFDTKDLILQIEDINLQFQNTEKIRSEGAEIQLESHFENGIRSYLALSSVNAKCEAIDSRMDNSPTLSASAGLSIPLFDQKLYISPELIYVSERKSTTTGDVPSYYLTNLSITTGTLFDNIDMSFNVYNLFDEGYDVPASGEHYFYDIINDTYPYYDIPQDGRTFRLQLSYRF